MVADLKQKDTHTDVNSCCYVPPLDFKSDAYWKYMAQIMFIVWTCLIALRKTHVRFLFILGLSALVPCVAECRQ